MKAFTFSMHDDLWAEILEAAAAVSAEPVAFLSDVIRGAVISKATERIQGGLNVEISKPDATAEAVGALALRAARACRHKLELAEA